MCVYAVVSLLRQWFTGVRRTNMHTKKIYVSYILLAGILWGSLGPFVRYLNTAGIASMDIVFLRAVVTAVALLVYLLIFHRDMLRIHIKDLWCFIGTGVASITFFNYCYFKAVITTSLSVAAVLLYTAPAIVMILSAMLFGEALNIKKVVAIVMTFSGCVLVTGVLSGDNQVTVQGILYGLGAGFGYALYSIFSRYALQKGYHSLTITCYTFVVATIATACLADVKKVWDIAVSTPGMSIVSVGLGLLCTVAAYLLYTHGLTRVDNSKAAVIASIEPVTATVLGMVLYAEEISPVKVIGMLMVIAGMVI